MARKSGCAARFLFVEFNDIWLLYVHSELESRFNFIEERSGAPVTGIVGRLTIQWPACEGRVCGEQVFADGA